jgi:hypothetical protein
MGYKDESHEIQKEIEGKEGKRWWEMKAMKFAKTALYILIVCQFLDGGLTYAGLSRGIEEANPVVFILMGIYGLLAAIILLKGLVILAAVLVIRWGLPHLGKLSLFVLSGCLVLYATTVLTWMVILCLDIC